ncbi:MAG: FkbM family methyltransferase [Moorea sp. SIO4A3]|nr:FkbM family methyltransferase [Moorena sp. SIO4A3]
MIYNDIFVDGEYDLPIKQSLASGLSGQPLNILDIGANVGYFTLRLADLILQGENSESDFRVTLVEGSPTIYKELKSRLNNQPNLADKFKIVHGLVGERQGSAKILESDFHVMNAVASSSSSGGTNVSYIDLESLYSESSEIDLLKCDIEGSELIFMENYKDLLWRVKSAVFELHHDRCDTARCFEILKDAGFLNHQQLRQESTFSLEFFWK